MPRWDYRCVRCGRVTTDSVNRSESCPACAKMMERLPSAPNFVLKGTGFHKNDYPKEGEMNALLFELAKRVKRGAALLDKKVPNWRTVMRKHANDFDISDGECCILGTLEHKSGLKKLGKIKHDSDYTAYGAALHRLRIAQGADYGFNVVDAEDIHDQFPVLQQLWRAEFER